MRLVKLEDTTRLHNSTERLGTDPLGKLILRLSLPSIASMVTASLYNLVNAFWVAKLGYQAIAAVTVVMPFFVFCMALGVGTGIGVNALTSRRLGENNTEGANQAVGQIFFLSIILGAVFLFLTNSFPGIILNICGITPDIMDMGTRYITVLGWGIPLFLFNIICRNVFAASGDTVRPMAFAITSQVINVILDPFLIFGWGIFPEMGVSGAALATVISMTVGAALPLWYILRKKTAYNLRFRHCIPNYAVIKEIFRVGLPSMLIEATESVLFAILNNVVATFGSVALAAMGIFGRLLDLVYMPVIGTSHGLLPIIGFSFGAKRWDRLWGAVKLTITWLSIILLVMFILLEIFTPHVIKLFNSDPELLQIGIPGMRIILASMVFWGFPIIIITTFQGLSKGKDAMVLSLVRQFLFFVPFLFLFKHLWGITGMWVAMPVSDLLGGTIAGLWLWREYIKQKNSGLWSNSAAIK